MKSDKIMFLCDRTTSLDGISPTQIKEGDILDVGKDVTPSDAEYFVTNGFAKYVDENKAQEPPVVEPVKIVEPIKRVETEPEPEQIKPKIRTKDEIKVEAESFGIDLDYRRSPAKLEKFLAEEKKKMVK